MSRRKDVPGNAIASQLAFDKQMVARGIALGRVDTYLDAYAEDDIFVLGMSIRIPQDVGEDYLVTVRASTTEGAVVAFHSAASFDEVIVGLSNRLQNKSLRWKDDQYSK